MTDRFRKPLARVLALILVLSLFAGMMPLALAQDAFEGNQEKSYQIAYSPDLQEENPEEIKQAEHIDSDDEEKYEDTADADAPLPTSDFQGIEPLNGVALLTIVDNRGGGEVIYVVTQAIADAARISAPINFTGVNGAGSRALQANATGVSMFALFDSLGIVIDPNNHLEFQAHNWAATQAQVIRWDYLSAQRYYFPNQAILPWNNSAVPPAAALPPAEMFEPRIPVEPIFADHQFGRLEFGQRAPHDQTRFISVQNMLSTTPNSGDNTINPTGGQIRIRDGNTNQHPAVTNINLASGTTVPNDTTISFDHPEMFFQGGGFIHFTTDGSIPTEESALYHWQPQQGPPGQRFNPVIRAADADQNGRVTLNTRVFGWRNMPSDVSTFHFYIEDFEYGHGTVGDATAASAEFSVAGAVEVHGYFTLNYLKNMAITRENVPFVHRNAATPPTIATELITGFRLSEFFTEVMELAPNAESVTITPLTGNPRTLYLNDEPGGIFSTDIHGEQIMIFFEDGSNTGLRLAIGQTGPEHANRGQWTNHVRSIVVNEAEDDDPGNGNDIPDYVLFEIIDRRGGGETVIFVTEEMAAAATPDATFNYTSVNLAGTRSLHENSSGPELITLFENLGITLADDNHLVFRAFDNFEMTMRWDWLTAQRYYFPNQRMDAQAATWNPANPPAIMFEGRVIVPTILATQQYGRLMFGQLAPHEQANNLSVRSMFTDPHFPRAGQPDWHRHGRITITNGNDFQFEPAVTTSPASGSTVRADTEVTFTHPPFASVAQGFVHFTTDGTLPTQNSPLYNHNMNGMGNLLRPVIRAEDADATGRVTLNVLVFGHARRTSDLATFYFYIDETGLGDATPDTAALSVTGAVIRDGFFSLDYLRELDFIQDRTFTTLNNAGTIGTRTVTGFDISDLLLQKMELMPAAYSVTIVPATGNPRTLYLDSTDLGIFWEDIENNRIMIFFESSSSTGLRLAVGQTDPTHANNGLWTNNVREIIVNAQAPDHPYVGDSTPDDADLFVTGAVFQHGYFSMAYLLDMGILQTATFVHRNAGGTVGTETLTGIPISALLTEVIEMFPGAHSVTFRTDNGGGERTFNLDDEQYGVFWTDMSGNQMMIYFDSASRTGLRLAIGQASPDHINRHLWVNHIIGISVNIDNDDVLMEIFDRRGGQNVRHVVTQEVWDSALALGSGNAYTFTAVNSGGFRLLQENVRGPELEHLLGELGIAMQGRNQLEVIGFDNFGQRMRWDYLMEDRYYFPNQRADAGHPWHSGMPPAIMWEDAVRVPTIITNTVANGRLLLGHRAPHEACNCLFVFNLLTDPHYPTPGWARNGRIIITEGNDNTFPAVTGVSPFSGSTVAEGTAITFTNPLFTHHTHGFVHYTTDGSEPTFHSALYNYSMHGNRVFNPIIRAEDADANGRVTVNVRVFGSARVPGPISTFYFYLEDGPVGPPGDATADTADFSVVGAVRYHGYFTLGYLENKGIVREDVSFRRINAAGTESWQTVTGIRLSELLLQTMTLDPDAYSITIVPTTGTARPTFYLNDEALGVFSTDIQGHQKMIFFDSGSNTGLRLAVGQTSPTHANLGMWTNNVQQIIVNAPVQPDPTLESIAVTAAPTRTTFTVGDTLDLAGLAITATLSDNTTRAATDFATSPVAGAVLNTVGTQTVTVSYTLDGVTRTATFTVTVEAVQVTPPVVLFEIVDQRGATPVVFQVTQAMADAATPATSFNFTNVNTFGTPSRIPNASGPVITDLFSDLGITVGAGDMVRFTARDNFTAQMRWDYLTQTRYYFPNMMTGFVAANPPASAFEGRIEVPAIIALNNLPSQQGRLMLGQVAPHEQINHLLVHSLAAQGDTMGRIFITSATNETFQTVTAVYPAADSLVAIGQTITFTAPNFFHSSDGFIHFTTDGSVPTQNSPLYNFNTWGGPGGAVFHPVIRAEDSDANDVVTVRARVFGANRQPSEIATFTFRIDVELPSPGPGNGGGGGGVTPPPPPQGDAVLAIFDGTTLVREFTRAQLDAINTLSPIAFSAMNSWPSLRTHHAENPVDLMQLLRGISGLSLNDSSEITFFARDGFNATLRIGDLTRTRYTFEGGSQTAVPAVLDIRNNGPRLIFGQLAQQEQTTQAFVEMIDRIVIGGEVGTFGVPTVTPAPGRVNQGDPIRLNLPTGSGEAKIYFTLDGSTPTVSSTMFNVVSERWFAQQNMTEHPPILAPSDEEFTITARIMGLGRHDGEIVRFTFNAPGTTAAPPVVTPPVGGGQAPTTVVEAENIPTGTDPVVTFTQNQLRDAITEAASADGNRMLGLNVGISQSLRSLTVRVPAPSIAQMIEVNLEALSISGSLGTTIYDTAALRSMHGQGSGSWFYNIIRAVDVDALNASQRAVVGDRSVYQVSLLRDGFEITNLDDGRVTIRLSYELSAGQRAQDVVVWILGEDGTLTPVGSTYNTVEQFIEFTLSNLGMFVIGYDTVAETLWNPFVDVNDSNWFYDYIRFVFEKGLKRGISDTEFRPNANLSRAMVVTVLWRQAGEPTSTYNMNFSDVAGGTWYTDAVHWAAEHGVVLGFGDGRFEPHDYITRAHLTMILTRYADFAEIELPETREFEAFYDANTIASYASEAVERAFLAGIINGRAGNMFDPAGNATRAEFSAMLYRFLG